MGHQRLKYPVLSARRDEVGLAEQPGPMAGHDSKIRPEGGNSYARVKREPFRTAALSPTPRRPGEGSTGWTFLSPVSVKHARCRARNNGRRPLPRAPRVVEFRRASCQPTKIDSLRFARPIGSLTWQLLDTHIFRTPPRLAFDSSTRAKQSLTTPRGPTPSNLRPPPQPPARASTPPPPS